MGGVWVLFSLFPWVYLWGVSAFLLCSGFLSPLKLAGPHLSNGCSSEGAVHKANSSAPVATLRVSVPLCFLSGRHEQFFIWVPWSLDILRSSGVVSFLSFFYRGDNDEEEPSKLKVEHHGLSVTGLQSPGKLHGWDFGKMYCYLLRWSSGLHLLCTLTDAACEPCIPGQHCPVLAPSQCGISAAYVAYPAPIIPWLFHVENEMSSKVYSTFSVPLNRQSFGIRISLTLVKTSVSFTEYPWQVRGRTSLCDCDTVCKGAVCKRDTEGRWWQLSNPNSRSTPACERGAVGVGRTEKL